MHAFNLASKSHFAIALSYSSSSRWWDGICWFLMSNMTALIFSNWLQATEINVVTRDGKPQAMPSDTSVVKHYKEGDI